MENTKTIKFVEIGTSLGTRVLASKIRENVLDDLEHEKIVFDFEGVDVITNSFANECFAKMLERISTDTFRSKFAFVNANDFVQRVIISSFH